MPGGTSRWQKRLKETSAAECLRVGTISQFPLGQVRAITEDFLASCSAGFLSTGVEPFTDQAETILNAELDDIRGQLRDYEVALLAASRGIRRNTLRARLASRAPDGILHAEDKSTYQDPLFEDSVAIYVQCLILSNQVSPQLVDDEECQAAREVFAFVKAFRRKAYEYFPAIWTALRVCARQGIDDEIIPSSMIISLLERNRFDDMFQREVQRLQDECKWARLHDLVSKFPTTDSHPRLKEILRLIIRPGRCLGILSWQPDKARIMLWEKKLSKDQRASAIAILKLEGPDTASQQGRTLKESGPGLFTGFDGSPSHEAVPLLSHLLTAFDRAILSGPSSLQWFLAECAVQPQFRTPETIRRSLKELDAAMDLKNDETVGTLSHFVRSLRTDMELRERLQAMSSALPLIGNSPELRNVCGHERALDRKAQVLLKEAQDRFGELLDHGHADHDLAGQLRRLGRAMYQAGWLHLTWPPTYVAMLAQMPNEAELPRFLGIASGTTLCPPGLTRQDFKTFLLVRLCGRVVPGFDQSPLTAALPPSPARSPRLSEDAPRVSWLDKTLDPNRTALRKKLLQIPRIDPDLVAACMESASDPNRDNFVLDLKDVLLFSTAKEGNDASDDDDEGTCPYNDQVCVNLTNLLADRVLPESKRSLPKCWSQLLLHMMRQRPPGMLSKDRLGGKEFSKQSWREWHKNLDKLFERTGHIGEKGGLGFTREAINEGTSRKAGPPGRHVSIASMPARIMERPSRASEESAGSSSGGRRPDAMHRRVTSATLPRRRQS